jgi:hypothetical protein
MHKKTELISCVAAIPPEVGVTLPLQPFCYPLIRL